MTEPHTINVFAGVTDHAGTSVLPDSYLRYAEQDVDSHFQGTLEDLTNRFDIARRPTGYVEFESGEFVQDSRFSAFVNPAWEGENAERPQATALWQIATESYSPANPMDSFGPLVTVVQRLDHPDIFGTFETYRNGGEWAVDVFFRDITVNDPESNEPRFILGIESGADYYTKKSLWGRVIAFDLNSESVMRNLSDTYSTPHRGDDASGRFANWYETIVGKVEKITDSLYETVANARATEIDIKGTPLNTIKWYEAQGFPSALAREAAQKATNRTVSGNPSAWVLYVAITETITSAYDGKRSGRALQDHATRANNILFAPKSAEKKALRNVREELVGQERLDPNEQAIVESIDTKLESLDEAVEKFVDLRDRIRTMLEETDTGGTPHE